MVTVGTLILVAILALVVGALGGAFFFKTWASGGTQSRELRQRLDEAERKYGDYQQEVTEHFAETARRVNNLTRQYRDVHEYLASSASKLTNPAISREMLEASQGKLASDEDSAYIDSETAAEADSAPAANRERELARES